MRVALPAGAFDPGGQERLTAYVEHVAQARGEWLDFDILSFEQSGNERYVQVKTAAFEQNPAFFASRKEVAFSEQAAEGYRRSSVFASKHGPQLLVGTGRLGG